MNNILYLECYAGISGDMFVASLLDLGVDKNYLMENLQTLPLDGYKIEISRVNIMRLITIIIAKNIIITMNIVV